MNKKRKVGRPPADGMSLREAVRIVTDNPRKYNDRIRAAHERLRRFLEKRA